MPWLDYTIGGLLSLMVVGLFVYFTWTIFVP